MELLIAIGIFATMAAMGYAGLSALLRNSSALEGHMGRLNALQQTYIVMQRDISQATSQTAQDQLGGLLPAVRGEASGPALAITRAGYPNPANVRRSHLLRVRFQLVNRQLLRMQWPEINRAPGDRTESTVLLDNVEEFAVLYQGVGGTSYDTWPPAGESADSMPRAIRVTLKVQGVNGVVHWLFALP